jgi:leucyl-tRNA synthetase
MVETKYRAVEIEQKWQQRWQADRLYHVTAEKSTPSYYALTMYPYPSGDLHMGHWYAIVPSDTRARWMRMQGYQVLFPMGFDSFGLPAENAAIQRGIHPKTWTYDNIARMRGQLRSMGAMFDWEREVITSDPRYYKWTQWFFRKLYDMGLAYKKLSPVDFCPKCNTTLAREQVWGDDRHCERCQTPVIRKDLNQWFFKITAYAEELLDFSQIDWPERVRSMQTNWIGRSTGAAVDFKTVEGEHPITVFTTRPDTLWGATFMVLAPEHPLVPALIQNERRAEVDAYIASASRATEIERLATDKEKTGVFTGAYAVNPVNQEHIPIWIADYVLMSYGTGAIMAVPAHDERDFAFARRYDLPLRVVIAPPDWTPGQELDAAYTSTETGVMVNSGAFDGTPVQEAISQVITWLETQRLGQGEVQYRLHDWLISRQRYWGAPIPMIECPTCGIVPVPYAELPVLLPEDVQFMPTGESPLKFHAAFQQVRCPQCGAAAQRETDTMDTFMCSSWYQYAYMNPHWKADEPLHATDIPFDPEEGEYWLPVDLYTGGVEHATMHLLYTRFFTKAMRDMGVVKFDEPMLRLYNQGIILGEDREKMSKSRGNVIAPDDLVRQYGADTVRGYLMFGFRWHLGGPWDSSGILGIQRFLERIWELVSGTTTVPATPTDEQVRELRRKQHQTIRKVSQDIERFAFNTMIAALMEYSNYLLQARSTPVVGHPAWADAIRTVVLLMAPAFPHAAEELWERIGGDYSVHHQTWPAWDEELAAEEMLTIVVQINGKLRDRFLASADLDEDTARAQALACEGVQRHLEGKQPLKVVYVPGRLVNMVVK